MGVQAVVFDIGNVLIEWQPERFFDAKIGVDRRKALFAAIDLHVMNDRIDRGANWAETVAEAAAEFPDWSDEIMMWHSHWLDMAQPEIPHSLALLRRLRAKGVPVFALSNFGVETFAYAETVYPFLKEFDRRYISGHMRLIKPETAIYAALEADCGLPPEGLLFADDRIDNIRAAAQRGWQVHLFDGPTGWAKALVDHGLLTPEEAEL